VSGDTKVAGRGGRRNKSYESATGTVTEQVAVDHHPATRMNPPLY
jgi:hypothetical protein